MCQLRKSKSVNAQAVDATTKERDELRVRERSLCAHVDDLQSEVGDLRAALQSNAADEQVQATRQVELESERRSFRHELAELQGELERVRSQVAESEKRFEGAQQSAFEAQRRAEALECDLAVAKADQARASTSSSNLQRVLEEFQNEKVLEISALSARSRKEIEAVKADHDFQLDLMKQELVKELRGKERELDLMRSEIGNLEGKLDGVTEEKNLEVSQMRQTLDKAIERITTKNEDVVDRRLIASIIVQYFAKNRSVEVITN